MSDDQKHALLIISNGFREEDQHNTYYFSFRLGKFIELPVFGSIWLIKLVLLESEEGDLPTPF